MKILNFFRGMLAAYHEKKEDELDEKLEKVIDFVDSLSPNETHYILVSMIQAGAEYEGISTDEFIDELSDKVVMRIRRNNNNDTAKSRNQNSSQNTKSVLH
ncbi:hypothetical protein PPM_p0007 (plasmid) [Paenibacillus polymyxa M1]|uniref:hypothetical protein n=1 Tax=Paenibacillus polymyxa TaxID=1406 RepID=UPI00021BBAF3|nr:hypothetical protein [Paenibacillus polymyxa]CCC86157.1 hypothetical protein PPM_p0007 [Paenibacillus polymyxa M1]